MSWSRSRWLRPQAWQMRRQHSRGRLCQVTDIMRHGGDESVRTAHAARDAGAAPGTVPDAPLPGGTPRGVRFTERAGPRTVPGASVTMAVCGNSVRLVAA